MISTTSLLTGTNASLTSCLKFLIDMKENCNCCCYQYWFHLHVSITQTRIWVHLFHEEELVCRKRMKFTELWWIFYILGEEVFYLKGTFISSKCTALYLTASATDNERIRRNEKRRLKRCQNGNENYFTINVKLDNIAISQLDNSLKSNDPNSFWSFIIFIV